MIRIAHKPESFVLQREIDLQQPYVAVAHDLLHERTGAGNDFLGWLNLATSWDEGELVRLEKAAKRIAETSNLLVVIGIGGSYLGTKAALHFLSHTFNEWLPEKGSLKVVFAGHNMSSTYLADLLDTLDRHEVTVNVISKSGTTTEPALAFRILQDYMIKRYGKEEAAKRIYATTDASRGALNQLARNSGYEMFVVPDDVGGRFSVLTPVGLLPLAAAGVDVRALLAGARAAEVDLATPKLSENPAYEYAVLRHILQQKGKSVEMFVSYEPGLHYLAEWWKQLYGESEGKDHKGLLPTSADFSTDLHSLGQYIQDGARLLFETVVRIKTPRRTLTIEPWDGDLDGLNYLAGRTLQDVNDTALEATAMAHAEGGVPNIVLELEDMSPRSLGYAFYFFEKACALSGYLLGVNPFDQPGVEAYKTNMFALLGKPGYETLRTQLQKATGR